MWRLYHARFSFTSFRNARLSWLKDFEQADKKCGGSARFGLLALLDVRDFAYFIPGFQGLLWSIQTDMCLNVFSEPCKHHWLKLWNEATILWKNLFDQAPVEMFSVCPEVTGFHERFEQTQQKASNVCA